MAKHPSASTWIGIDAGKDDLVIDDGHAIVRINNGRQAIGAWLRAATGPLHIAIEATGTYHRRAVELAHAAGHRVYVLDGFRLNRYRESVGTRAKHDPGDARLLRRYLQREHTDLRPWTPPPPSYDQLQRLLGRRAKLVQTRTRLRQSLADLPELRRHVEQLIDRIGRLIILFDQRIETIASQAALPIAALRAIEGIGALTATALANAYQRGHFSSSDAFIAFLGLDVRVRDSGRARGRRKLTKQGDPERRRLLFNAAMAASRSARFKPVYERYLARGLTRIQGLVILARKLARIAFALLRSGQPYRPGATEGHCATT